MLERTADRLSRRLTVAVGLHQLLARRAIFYTLAVILEAVARDLGATRGSFLARFLGA